MKLTSSRWVNRILVALMVLTGLVFVLLYFANRQAEKIEAEYAVHFEQWDKSASQRPLWVKAEPPDKSYSVLLPGRPVLLTNYVHSPNGLSPLMQLGSTIGGQSSFDETYIAGSTLFPTNMDLSNPDAIYDSAHARFAGKAGRIRHEKQIVLQGIHGREIDVELGSGTNRMVERVYVGHGRLYQLSAVMPFSHEPTTDTWRFLDSLHLNVD